MELYGNERLINKILDNVILVGGCWEWQKHKGIGRFNYGQQWVRERKKVFSVHRLSYELFVGQIGEGKSVCHHCDNPPCCSPAHLFTGTHEDNMRDCIRKGRACRGTDHNAVKLVEREVIEIRNRVASGENLALIAIDFNVTLANVIAIARGNTWRTVGGQRSGMRRRKRLTRDEQNKILLYYNSTGESMRSTSRHFGIDHHAVMKIVSGKGW